MTWVMFGCLLVLFSFLLFMSFTGRCYRPFVSGRKNILYYNKSHGNKMLLFCDCRDNWEALKNINYCGHQMATYSIRFKQPHHSFFSNARLAEKSNLKC